MEPPRAIGDPELLQPIEGVPIGLWRQYNGAVECLEVQVLPAAAGMARRVVETALMDRGVEHDNLFAMIEKAASEGLISESVKRLCNTTRVLGNKGAHAQERSEEGITQKDARRAVERARDILRELYHPDYVGPTT